MMNEILSFKSLISNFERQERAEGHPTRLYIKVVNIACLMTLNDN